MPQFTFTDFLSSAENGGIELHEWISNAPFSVLQFHQRLIKPQSSTGTV